MTARQNVSVVGPLVFLAALIGLLAGPRGPAVAAAAVAASRPSRTLPVFIFAGQSNMIVLKTLATDLTPEQRLPQAHVLFYGPDETGSTWAPLEPPTTSDGGFGPETSTGAYLTTFNQYPMVAEVKLAKSGTNLAYWWDPDRPGSHYYTLLTRVLSATQSLQAERPGDGVYIAGFFWMQGEADALDAGDAAAYEVNLDHFIDRVREDYGDPDLPFILGRIRDTMAYPYAGQVRAAQDHVAATKPHIGLVNTDFLQRNEDYIHFSSAGTYELGRLFAYAFIRLLLSPQAYFPMIGR